MELIDKNELVKSFWRGVEEGDICSFEDTEDFIKNAPRRGCRTCGVL